MAAYDYNEIAEDIRNARQRLHNNLNARIFDLRVKIRDDGAFLVSAESSCRSNDQVAKENALEDFASIKNLFLRIYNTFPEMKTLVDGKTIVYRLYRGDGRGWVLKYVQK